MTPSFPSPSPGRSVPARYSLGGRPGMAWRSLLLATMGEPLNPDELIFIRFTGRTTPPAQRVDELWCCVGRRGAKSRGMAVLATYLAGLGNSH